MSRTILLTVGSALALGGCAQPILSQSMALIDKDDISKKYLAGEKVSKLDLAKALSNSMGFSTGMLIRCGLERFSTTAESNNAMMIEPFSYSDQEEIAAAYKRGLHVATLSYERPSPEICFDAVNKSREIVELAKKTFK